LAYCQAYPTRSMAMQTEYAIKQFSRDTKLVLIKIYEDRELIAQLG
jgi:predicted GIY-YIG superfamily endonuclease